MYRELQRDDDDGADDGGMLLLDRATIDARREEELARIASDASLTEGERSKAATEVRAKYGLMETEAKVARLSAAGAADGRSAAPPPAPALTRAEREVRSSKGRRSSVDLSAKSAQIKKEMELAALSRAGAPLKERMALYDGSVHARAVGGGQGEQHTERRPTAFSNVRRATRDEMRREELMAVMKDGGLGKEEKARRMDEVRAKYGVVAPQSSWTHCVKLIVYFDFV